MTRKERSRTVHRSLLGIVVATATVTAILVGEIWAMHRAFSSRTACYISLSNDLAPLFNPALVDGAAATPACTIDDTAQDSRSHGQ